VTVRATERVERSVDGSSAARSTLSRRSEGSALGARLGAYVALTKPRVIELLLVTTIPAMLLAERGTVSPLLIVTTLIGGWMAAASANTLNCVADADIDAVMKRTASRPLARAAVPTHNALVFGVVLGVASFGWLWITANLLSGVLAVATILFYVFVYTLLLKRRTSQNVVWGGAAGCMPVVIGWSAVTGSVSWPALAMFGVIFCWTPPHTWALAMRFKDDYARAGVPMLPVVKTPVEVTRRIVVYTVLMVVMSLTLLAAAGWLYGAVALLAGAWFAAMAVRLHLATRGGAVTSPMRLFHLSNTYLSLLFVGLAVDSVLALPVLF